MNKSTSLSRRQALRLGGAFASTLALQPVTAQTQTEPIVVGQTAALTGNQSGPFIEMNKGIQAGLAEINSKGGILGRPLRLVSLDDGGSGDKAKANALQLVEREKVLALFACGGTASVLGALPVAESTGTPFVAPATGSEAVRAYNPLVVHTRAGYSAEIARIVQQMATVGYERCAIVHSGGVFGQSVLAAFEAAAIRLKLTQWRAFTVGTPEEVPKAIEDLVQWAPTAVFAVPLGGTGVSYFKQLQRRAKVPRFTLSMFGNKAALANLGEAALGIVVSQVVPNPENTGIVAVRDYRAALKKAGIAEISYSGLEGYLNIRILGEALLRTGKNPARERLMPLFLTMRPYNLGGYEVSYSPNHHEGSHFVELAYYDGVRFRR